MAQTEAICMQVDALRIELNGLEIENRQLKENWPEQAVMLELELENAHLERELNQLKMLYKQQEVLVQHRIGLDCIGCKRWKQRRCLWWDIGQS